MEEVSCFEYLGNIITGNGSADTDINNKLKKATRIYYSINRTILGKKEIDKRTKLRVYNAITLPTITYGCESWTLQRKHESPINAIEMKYLRKIAEVTKFDRIRSEDIRTSLEQEPITKKIENRQLSWFGHILRMDQNRLTKKVISAKPNYKKRRGRPKKTWIGRINEIGTNRGKTLEEMRRLAVSRQEWKKWLREPNPDA